MTARLFRYDFSLWYCLDDDPLASAIGETLAQQGFRGYLEHQDQAAGRSALASAAEIIQSSRVAIVLLTGRSVANPWCQRLAEWNLLHMVENEGVKVIPVSVDLSPEQLPLPLRHLHGLQYGDRFFQQKLLKSLQPSRRPATRAPRPPSSSMASASSRVGFS